MRSNREMADWVLKNIDIPEKSAGYIKARIRAILNEKDIAHERELDLARSGGYLEGQRNSG